MSNDTLLFCKRMPKLELHAHLNGSVSEKTLLGLLKDSEDHGKTYGHLKHIITNSKDRSLDDCFQMFGLIHLLTVNPTIIRRITREVIQDFANDGVIYLELRSTPRQVKGSMSKKEYINAITATIKECKEMCPIIVKLLISIDRKSGIADARENLQLALEEKMQNPDIVIGIDLSGNPAIGDVSDYLPVLESARASGFPLAVHCAEVPDELETKKILQLCPERLGHGTCIHPDAGGSDELWKMLVDSRIPVELCLTSNIMTATVKEYKNHHFDYLYKNGHPIVLGTDDKGVFSTSLSNEYCIAAKTFQLNNSQLWQLSYDSIGYAFASEHEKEKLQLILKEWMKNMSENCKTD